jgi:hypothetical protein
MSDTSAKYRRAGTVCGEKVLTNPRVTSHAMRFSGRIINIVRSSKQVTSVQLRNINNCRDGFNRVDTLL